MNEITLNGNVLTADIEKVKLNSGYLNNVLFAPEYQGRGFVNTIKLEMNVSNVTNTNEVIEKMLKSKEELSENEAWYTATCQAKVTGRLRANNYENNGETVRQNVIEVDSIEFV